MNAVSNDPMLECIDTAAVFVHVARTLIQQALAGEKDADLYGCTLDEIDKTLALAQADLKAVGAKV